jgi:predicted nucleic acid-binding protein
VATEWLVDTNVLIDVIQDDPHFAEASVRALERCARQGVLVINPIIYAEVGAVCDSIEELDALNRSRLY